MALVQVGVGEVDDHGEEVPVRHGGWVTEDLVLSSLVLEAWLAEMAAFRMSILMRAVPSGLTSRA